MTDQNKKSHCISCDSISCLNAAGGEICGTDGITYKDECDLRKRACRARKNTSIAYYQTCLSKCTGVFASRVFGPLRSLTRRVYGAVWEAQLCAAYRGYDAMAARSFWKLHWFDHPGDSATVGEPFPWDYSRGAVDESVGGRGAEGAFSSINSKRRVANLSYYFVKAAHRAQR